MPSWIFIVLCLGFFGLGVGFVFYALINYLTNQMIEQYQAFYSNHSGDAGCDKAVDHQEIFGHAIKNKGGESNIGELFCVIALSTALPVVLYLTMGLNIEMVSYWLFGVFALILAFIDIRLRLLPDILVYPLLWVGLLAHAFEWIPGTLKNAVIGAVAGYLILWVLRAIYLYLRKIEGMGLGDAKLLAAVGAWLGWKALLPVMLIASVTGLCWSVMMMFRYGKEEGRQISFGPFLLLGGFVMLLEIPFLTDYVQINI